MNLNIPREKVLNISRKEKLERVGLDKTFTEDELSNEILDHIYFKLWKAGKLKTKKNDLKN